MAIRPPAAWIRQAGSGPVLVKFFQPHDDPKRRSELLVTHLQSGNPTPLETFKKQARTLVTADYPGAKVLEEKEIPIAGKRAFRITFVHDGIVLLKTVVHRNNLDYYLLDAAFPEDQSATLKPLVEASIASFEIVPAPLNSDEKAADARTLELLRSAKLDRALLGERWFGIFVGSKKVGHMRVKLSESEGMYALETDALSDLGDGNKEQSNVRGSFSPDARVQKIDGELQKANPKDKWQFRSSSVIQGNKAKISRDVNGLKEERTFAVEEGVLLNDVVEAMRAILVGAGKGTYLLKTLSPFSEEWTRETVDVGEAETLEVDGRSRPCVLVQTSSGLRKALTYYYATDRTLLRLGGPRELLTIRALSKEDALK